MKMLKKWMYSQDEISVEVYLGFIDELQFYWGNAEVFKQQNSLFSKSATPYIFPRYLVQDIDTLEDWKCAELIHHVLKKSGELD